MNSVARTKVPLSRGGAFALVLMIFAGLGPLVGSFAVWIFVSAGRAMNMGLVHSDPVGYFSALALVLVFGYLIGIVYALISGLVVAVVGIFMQWNNVLVAIVAAAAASAAGSAIPWIHLRIFTGQMNQLGIFPVCLAAALVCWFVTRGIVRATWQSA